MQASYTIRLEATEQRNQSAGQIAARHNIFPQMVPYSMSSNTTFVRKAVENRVSVVAVVIGLFGVLNSGWVDRCTQ